MHAQRLGSVVGGLLVIAAAAHAQLPGAGAPVGAPVGAPGGAAGLGATGLAGAGAGAGAAAPAAAAAPPRNIYSFFMMTPEQKLMHQQNSAICRAKFCGSKLGQFVNNALMPAGAVTGGLLGPLCPGPTAANPADLQKPATSPQGAAARIMEEEAQVGAKVAAIEFLGTVDCRYYPEAEAGLIVGLRAEKNICVRLAAAKALAGGCCCTQKILKALTTSVNSSAEDKFPAERSELVRAFAYVALERCLRACQDAEPDDPPEPPAAAKQAVYETLTPFGPLADYTTQVLQASYYAAGAVGLPPGLYERARRVLARGLKLTPDTIAKLSGPRTVMDAVAPGYDAPRAAGLVEKPDPRGRDTSPGWIKTLPKTPAEPPVAAAAFAPVSVSADTAAATPPRTGRANLLHIVQDARPR